MWNEGKRTFVAGEALEAARRVKLSTGVANQVEYADAADDYVGVTLDKAASGDPILVALKRNYPGTVEVCASVAITVNATLYGAADGKVGIATTGNDKYGKALEAASGDGAIIESLMDD